MAKKCIHDNHTQYCVQCKIEGTGGTSLCDDHHARKARCKKCFDLGIIGAELCEHRNQKARCKDCRSSGVEITGVCEHKKRKENCKTCKVNGVGGSSLCEHMRVRVTCRVCAQLGEKTIICKHGKYNSAMCVKCKEEGTGGKFVCEHNLVRKFCKRCYEADPAGNYRFCLHGKFPHQCLECDNVYSCEHKKWRTNCLICQKNLRCEHGVRKSSCAKCTPGIICPHENLQRSCYQCFVSTGYVSGRCVHGKLKGICPETGCYGSQLCEHGVRASCLTCCKKVYNCTQCDFITPKNCYLRQHSAEKHGVNAKICDTCASFVYHPALFKDAATGLIASLCQHCYQRRAGHYTRVEKRVVKELKKDTEIAPYIILEDTILRGVACQTRRRPDIVISCGPECHIVVECDEHQHRDYKPECEISRMSEIYDELDGKVIFLRFNPHNYKPSSGRRVLLEDRMEKLKDTIKFCAKKLGDLPDRRWFEIIYMYYSVDNTNTVDRSDVVVNHLH